jgi:hypothetical protein
MKAAARLHYLALGCAVASALLVAVSCGGEGGEPLATATPLASPTPVAPPEGTVMPISEGDALWEWIAANSPECEPILRPTYLPSSLSRLSLDYVDQQRGCVLFNVVYTDSAGQARLSVGGGPWFNLPLAGADSLQEQVEVRATTGLYQLQNAAEPLGYAFLTWNEPGRWGRTGDDWHRDYVEYLMSSEGFPKEELLKVANALEPMQR